MGQQCRFRAAFQGQGKVSPRSLEIALFLVSMFFCHTCSLGLYLGYCSSNALCIQLLIDSSSSLSCKFKEFIC